MAKELSKMSDAEYKALSPQQLMQYNKQMPERDYENPYVHQHYPSVRYRLVQDAESGLQRMQTALVHSAREDEALGDGWKKTPAEFGVETAPSAPAIQIDDSFEVALTPPAPEPVVLKPVEAEKRNTLHVPKKDAASRA